MATRTQEAYIRAVYELAKHYHKGPDQLGDEELKSYLYYLAQERKLSPSSVNQVVCGLRLFYKTVLQRSVDFLCTALPYRNRRVRRPQVFSVEEVERLLTVGCPRLKAHTRCPWFLRISPARSPRRAARPANYSALFARRPKR